MMVAVFAHIVQVLSKSVPDSGHVGSVNLRCACHQHGYTVANVSTASINTKGHMTHFLRVDGTLQLSKVGLRIYSTKENALILVHASILQGN